MNIKQQKNQPNNVAYNLMRIKDTQKQFQNYFSANLVFYANNIKKCIPDLDTQSESRYIKKTDKIFIETHLNQVYNTFCQKLQCIMISKNNDVKKIVEEYYINFQELSEELKQLIVKNTHIKQSIKVQSMQKNLKQLPQINNKFSAIKIRKKPQKFQTITSQYDAQSNQPNNRKIFTSKRLFRNKQLTKNYLGDILSNERYIKRLQKINYQTSFTDTFFQNVGGRKNPQESEQNSFSLSNLRKDWNKLKLISSMKSDFQTIQQKSTNGQICHYTKKSSLSRNFDPHINSINIIGKINSVQNKNNKHNSVCCQNNNFNQTNLNFSYNCLSREENKKINNLTGVQLRKLSEYKPKSKCRFRNPKKLLQF